MNFSQLMVFQLRKGGKNNERMPTSQAVQLFTPILIKGVFITRDIDSFNKINILNV